MKNHDVDGRAIKTDRRKYIVQIREPVPSIVSHFEMAVADKHIEDSAAQWRAFAIAQARYRNRFVAKWLVKRPQHTMVLHYEDARAEPAVALRDLCRFVFDCEPDEDRIASIAGNVAGGRKVEEFRYYDHTFFASLHRRSAPAERLTDSFRRF